MDGKLLRPDCVACTGAATIAYVQEALVDVREHDTLSVRAQGEGGFRTTRVTDAAQALRWFKEQMPAAVRGDPTAAGAKSGTRPIVRPGATAKPSKPDSKVS